MPIGDAGVRRALVASELRYRRLFEAARDGILMLDATSGAITAVNPYLADLLGYSPPEILGKKLWDLSPSEDAGKGRIAFEELQSREYLRYDDLPLQTKDGRLIAVEFVSNSYMSGDARVIQCNIRDITERKNADLERHASDLRYRTLFESAPDGILIADSRGCYLDANASASRMLGYSVQELMGKQASDIVLPAEVQHISPALATIHARHDYQREWQFQRKNKTVFSADVMVLAMPDGNLLAMLRDVTTRNEADRALRSAEERMRFALEAANVGIWDMDFSTGLQRWSAILEAQHGLAPGGFNGTLDALLALVHPDDRVRMIETMTNADKTGANFSMPYRALWPDGTVRWLTGTGRVLLGKFGEPVRALGITQDVTDSRTLEDQYRQAQKMEAVGQLAGGVAHDFNNLLTVILGFCELLQADVTANEARRGDVGEIQKAGLRAAELTRQLLTFSRKEIIQPALLDLNAILTDMQPMLGRLMRDDVKVMLHIREGLCRIMADRGQVEQVVLNLAVNAQDAMPSGGTLTLETANVVLDQHYASVHVGVAPGPYVALTVTDTGTGMKPEVRARSFEPFFTTKEVSKDTGLGLATVHGIVARSGGSVTVASELGRGTVFTVHFLQASAADAVAASPAAPLPRTGTERVLVVDDADGVRYLAKRLLEHQGYRVSVAANADEAMKRFEENPSLDLLLTDVVMPGGSGPELAARLMKLRPALKVIYMSGYTDETIVRHGVLQPGIAFLHKPFTAAALGMKIQQVLDATGTST